MVEFLILFLALPTVVLLGRFRVPALPLLWLVSATMTASYQKIWDPDPGLGFLAHARMLADQIAAGTIPAAQIFTTQKLIFNDRLDAGVTLVFAVLVFVILVESGRNWWLYASGRKRAVLSESPVELSRIPA